MLFARVDALPICCLPQSLGQWSTCFMLHICSRLGSLYLRFLHTLCALSSYFVTIHFHFLFSVKLRLAWRFSLFVICAMFHQVLFSFVFHLIALSFILRLFEYEKACFVHNVSSAKLFTELHQCITHIFTVCVSLGNFSIHCMGSAM